MMKVVREIEGPERTMPTSVPHRKRVSKETSTTRALLTRQEITTAPTVDKLTPLILARL